VAAWLTRLVARVPAPIHAKLLAAFLAIVVLLIAVGAAGLQALTGANRRAEELVTLQRKIAAYRQLQHDTTAQLHSVDSALLVPDDGTLEATLRQLNQFGYDLDRLRFVARDELELLGQAQEDYDQFIHVVTRVVELIRAGEVDEGQALQVAEAGPLADRLERLTNQLVNRAEADMVAQVEANQAAYVTSRWVVVGLGLGSIVLALVLGYAISWSVIVPVRRMEARLRAIAAGDFSRRVEVPNRDELGALAADLNRMNDELGRLYRQLEDASRHKSEFLANMSHELRTPLNAINGFSEVLLERMVGELNERQDEYLRDILASGQHLLALINEILDLSKVEAGRMELEWGTFSLPEALASGLTMVRERAGRNGVALHLEVDPAVDLIEADERKVKQVLFNLLSNAVKFTPAGGRVDLTARLAGGEVHVAVHDTGIGIAPADQGRIFESFHQAEQGPAAEHEGTGLGLALAKELVALHGGRLWVESEVGAGSAFTFALPRRRPATPEGAAPIPDAPAAAAVAAAAAEAVREDAAVA
jgi:signal transduction histidine kinase